mmetsp:Transcript_21926/g.74347  ORF Transcript_21926/g.74347 Transcript_21926/m.74347 type:complete len:448 (+) Transcript_21926:714-2057(+)
MIFSWLDILVAKLAMPIAAYLWHKKSGDDRVGTIGNKAPAETIAAVLAYSADRLAIALTASLCTSIDFDRKTYFKCCSKPVSIIGPWFSSASAKLAKTPQAWWAISTSSEWANLMRASIPFACTIATLFASDNERFRKAAATSRNTSTLSDLSARSRSGAKPFISTNWKRHFGVSANCRMARQACKCVSWSGSFKRCTKGLKAPARSKARWFFSFAATLDKAKATHRRVSRSSLDASGNKAATAPESKSSWWLEETMAKFPMAKTPKRLATWSSPRAKFTIWGTAPAFCKCDCESRFAANKAKARATSRRTSASGEEANKSKNRRAPSSKSLRCVRPSTISARFATQAQACVSRTASRDCINATRARKAPERAMVTLFSSPKAKLHSAAPTSRCTSTESEFAAKIKGSKAPSRTSCRRIAGCVARPLMAAIAWNWTSAIAESVDGNA